MLGGRQQAPGLTAPSKPSHGILALKLGVAGEKPARRRPPIDPARLHEPSMRAGQARPICSRRPGKLPRGSLPPVARLREAAPLISRASRDVRGPGTPEGSFRLTRVDPRCHRGPLARQPQFFAFCSAIGQQAGDSVGWPETGEVAERLNAPVSKTGMGFQSIGGSNPPLSVISPCSGPEQGACRQGCRSGRLAVGQRRPAWDRDPCGSFPFHSLRRSGPDRWPPHSRATT
jgi:hypothetical protein